MNNGTRRWRALVVVAVSLLASIGCSSKSSSSGRSGSRANPTATASPSSAVAASGITIRSFKFVPNPLTVKVGATVGVTNDDGTNHSLTADDGTFDTGVFSTGSKTIQLTRAGTFKFHCQVHNFMTGTINVTP
jgi:plastocyanin